MILKSTYLNVFSFLILISIVVACSPALSPLVDTRDGTTYETVKIGSQVWMASNLNHKMDGAFAYDNNDEIAAKMGLLYIWDASMKACPTDWHLPSDQEWTDMENSLGNDPLLGKMLKSTTDWKNNNNGENSKGFNVYPAGYVGNGGKRSGSMGEYSFFWTSTSEGPGSEDRVWRRLFHMDSDTITRNRSYKDNGYSLRCIKD
jgi:uncharacterized protein (TIGR02145 family)